MKHKYLEVDMKPDGIFIYDNSLYIECVEHNGNMYLASKYKSGYVTVSGKETTYHIKGLGENVKRCQEFAIWYHVNKASGNISAYRLD